MYTKIMPKAILFLTAVLISMAITCTTASAADDEITLNLPEKVLAETLTKLLPMEFPADSSSLKGKIIIKKVSDVQLLDQHLRCRLHLIGDQLKVLTELAGNSISLNVGTIELDFTAKARLRFDPESQTLYVTPVVDEINNNQDAAGGDIGQTLLALFNGQEFPISMRDLDPIVTRAGTKTVTIDTWIADIQAYPQRLQLSLKPRITASSSGS